MSWNGADLFVRATTLDALPPSLSPTGTRGGFEEFPAAARVCGGWVHVHFGSAGFDLVPEPSELETGAGRVVVARYVGVADAYGLELHEDGVRVREHVVSEGEVVVDVGAPLPEESPAGEDDLEQWLFDVLERLTGIAVPDLTDTGGWVAVGR